MSLLNPLPQCISSAFPCLHICSLNLMCLSCQLDEPYGFSGDHLHNAAMLQCVSRYLQSISITVPLLYSVGNKTYSYCYCYYCYYVYDRGCWHMYIDTTPGSVPSKASSSSCLLAEGKTLPYLTVSNWFAILHRFVPFRSLLRQMQLWNSHDLLHMLNSSCKAVSSAVAPHIHWITSCSWTPIVLGTWNNRNCWQKMPQMTAL